MMKGFSLLMFFLSKDVAFGQENSCADIDSLKANAWHFHYVYNETTAAIADYFTDRFVEQFMDYFPSEAELNVLLDQTMGVHLINTSVSWEDSLVATMLLGQTLSGVSSFQKSIWQK